MQSKTAIFILSIISIFIVVIFVSFFFVQKGNIDRALQPAIQKTAKQEPSSADTLADKSKQYSLEEIDAYINPSYSPEELEAKRRKYLTEKYGAKKAELMLQDWKNKTYFR